MHGRQTTGRAALRNTEAHEREESNARREEGRTQADERARLLGPWCRVQDSAVTAALARRRLHRSP